MDVRAERVISGPPEKVAGYVMDYRHDPDWTAIKTVALTGEAPGGGFGAGAQVTRTAFFLGRRTDYVMNVERYDPPSVMEMRSVRAPFPMQVTYQFQPHPEGTLVSIRIRSDGGRLMRMAGPLMRATVLATIRGDLKSLSGSVS
ncbi:MAG TPA: SRPBCC family protein [Streptosporangiaceae bacterium]|nr:SRPBCC family protein [Streptosporangiaceae bacterium]